MGELTPHPIAVGQRDLDDLRDRLARTRWPEREAVDDWSQGIPLAYVQELCASWAADYDWRRVEAELNRFEQVRFVPDVGSPDRVGIQVLHAPSPHPGALPLVLTHGWPGSVVEFLDVVEPLRDPVPHGGEPADAFHVVCPSMPGYGFSDKPTAAGWGVERIASAWVELMVALGYQTFGAQGGDWGSAVTTALGGSHAVHCVGIHLNMVSAGPGKEPGELTDAEQAALAHLEEHRRWGMGYSTQQSTRPQTLGYGLADSPAAQAAWIVEKFWAWTDNDGHPEDAVARDRLLDNVMHYWLPGAGASSGRLYWESFGRSFGGADRRTIDVPAGVSIFPAEIFTPSRRWAERRFSDIREWVEHDRGGHFAALEQPAAFVDDVRGFFRHVR